MGWSNQAITQIIIQAQATGSGLYVYSGAPASGNLVAAITGDGVQTDPYGNVYAGIMDVGGFLTVNSSGQIFQFNGSGAQTSFLDGTDGVFILYKNTGSAVQGGIALALSQQAYTDAFGNAINAGLTLARQTPPTPSDYGTLYVGNGTGGSSNGALYYLSPGGTYTNVAPD